MTILASVTVITVAFWAHASSVENAVLRRAQAVASQLPESAGSVSPARAQETVDEWFSSGVVVAAVVFSPAGEVVAGVPAFAGHSSVLATWPESDGEMTELEVEHVPSVAVATNLQDGGRAWVVFERRPYEKSLRMMLLVSAGAGLVVVLVALIVSLVIGGSVVAPFQDLRRTFDRLRDGDFKARYTAGGSAEIQLLGRSINQLAEEFDGRLRQMSQERSTLELQVSGRTRELEQANRLLMDIANRDALTGLANRRRLEMELERSIAFSKRTNQPLAVIMMDLDNFKICNDTAGHLVGDNILRAVASTLRSRVRVTDLVVRWGGDEFCILVPATRPQGAVAAAEILVEAVGEATARVPLPEPLDPPTASAGVACFPEDGEDPNTLILNADAALYQVKATGRGRVLRYSPEFSKSS
jgi:diguanylate cyclase (GGDEF)-like protein